MDLCRFRIGIRDHCLVFQIILRGKNVLGVKTVLRAKNVLGVKTVLRAKTVLGAKITAFGVICLLISFCSCSERERLNPLDPKNPNTRGNVTGLSIVSNRDTVQVQWTPLEVEDLLFYEIYRSVGDSLLQSYDTLDASCNMYYDFPVNYDIYHQYGIRVQTTTHQSTLSDIVSIIPGPFNFIVSDFYHFNLKKLTYDGNHLMASHYIDSPIDISSYYPFSGFLVADYWNQQVHLIDRHLSTQIVFNLENYPIALSANGSQGEFYVILKNINALSAYLISGDLKTTVQLPFDVSQDTEMDFDRIMRCLWIVHSEIDSIYCADLSSFYMEIRVYSKAYHPRRIAVDTRIGGCWVASDSGIVRIQPHRVVQTYKEGYSISDVSYNSENGDCYYTGYQIQNGKWETGRIVGEPGFQNEVILGDEFRYLIRIQVIPSVENRGFLVLNSQKGELLRFNQDGSLIGQMGGFSEVIEIALE